MFSSNNSKSVVIFSVEKKDLNKVQNKARTEPIESYLKRAEIPFKKIIGSYFGTLETSFIISHKNYTEDRILRGEIFDRFDQESILHVDKDKTAKLEYSGGFFEEIGTLKRVTVAEAMNNEDNFSIDGNSAYIVD